LALANIARPVVATRSWWQRWLAAIRRASAAGRRRSHELSVGNCARRPVQPGNRVDVRLQPRQRWL